MSAQNLNYHVEIVAPTGSGKTNLLKNLIEQRVAQGHGIVFLDFKAEFELVSWMGRVLKRSGREEDLRVISLSQPEISVPYNPLKGGDAPDIHSALMNSMTWSEQYYRGVASVTLMTVLRALCQYRDFTNYFFHLGTLFTLLNEPSTMRALADKMAEHKLSLSVSLTQLAEQLDKPTEKAKLAGLISNLNQMVYSAAGPLLTDDVIYGSFNFKEAISQSRVTVMLMNSLKLKESAQMLGKIILQDLMNFVGSHYAQFEPGEKRPITLVIDEFASFATPQFIEFMDRARGAGIGIVIAHQARADLKSISPEFQERVEANSNTTIVSGIKSSVDAEYYAGMLGTFSTIAQTIQRQEGLLFDLPTGMKSERQVEEYILHPNRLRELKQGEVFVISKTVDPNWGLVQIPKACEFLEFAISTTEILDSLRGMKAYYQRGLDSYLDLSAVSPQSLTYLAGKTKETWD